MLDRNAPIPITGVAICNALGTDWAGVRDGLYAGRSGLTPCTIPVPFETVVGAVDLELPELPNALSGWGTRSARMAMHMLGEIAPQVDAMRGRWNPARVAVLLGTSTAGADETEAAYKRFVNEGALPVGYDLWKHHTYGALLHVVRELTGAAGPAWMVSTACTSSAKVVASAQRMIRAGVVDAAIVGGIDTLCAMTLSGFYSLGALSSEPCKPFAADRKGINIGEGGAFLLLERDGDALGTIEGVGESSDAYHVSAPHPEGQGAELAMRRALEDASLGASAIDHINAHGTGTKLNDAAEAKAIARAFAEDVPVVSTKCYTGHTLGGAGATEAALGLMAIREGWIPAALRCDPVDEGVTLNIPPARVDGPVRRVLSNSFAFGGNNISVVVGPA